MLDKILLSLVIVLLLVLQVIQPWASTEGQEEKSAVPQETPSLDVMPPLESVEKKLERNLADASSAKSPEERIEQRLLLLEQKLARRLDTEKRIEAASQKISSDVTFYTSIIANSFNVLAVFAAILAVAGIGITYFSSRSYRQDIKAHAQELTSIIKRARVHERTLQDMLAAHSPTEKFTTAILARAREAVKKGVGTDVLWGYAVLAQEDKRWQDALIFWDGVLKDFPDDTNALFGASLAALNLAQKTTGAEQQAYFQRAEEYFNNFSPKERSAAVYNNWGILCTIRGKASPSPEICNRFFELAAVKYEYAAQENPHHAASWSNWGNLCMEQAAAAESAEERQSFLALAGTKYERATQENPHHGANWFNWGNLCMEQAAAAESAEERQSFLALAGTKYGRAVQENPHDAASWSNWGNLCMEQAKAVEDAKERGHFLALAGAKYERATQENPHDAPSWFNWGNLCMEQAKAVEDAKERKHFLESANSKYGRATQEDPHNVASWFIWGLLCREQATAAETAEEHKSFLVLAGDKFKRATQENPHDTTSWLSWGDVCREQAIAAETAEERKKFFALAETKFERATQEDPHDTNSWFTWGVLCKEQAIAAESAEERKKFFALAETKFERATQEDPHDAASWFSWGVLYKEQAISTENAEERKSFFALADTKFERAIQENPYDAASWFDRACISALFNRPAACVHFLKKWREIQPNTLIDELDDNPEFNLVRGSQEFMAFRDTLRKKSS